MARPIPAYTASCDGLRLPEAETASPAPSSSTAAAGAGTRGAGPRHHPDEYEFNILAPIVGLLGPRVPETPRNRIALAARDLPQGAVLREEDVRVVSWASSELPAGLRQLARRAGGPRPDGAGAGERAAPRQQARRPRVGRRPSHPHPDGMRAVSVRVDEVVSVAGFVLQGTRVDVMVTIDQEGSDNNTITRVVLQNVPVLATARPTARRGGQAADGLGGDAPGFARGRRAARARLQPGPHPARLRNVLDTERRDQRRPGREPGEPDRLDPDRRGRAGRRGGADDPAARLTSTTVETIRGGQRTLNTFSGNE
jgi:Flp pilus assembly protein CpaB